MSLDSLRITECPAAFVVFAEKHNALVDMLAAMRGENGVSVTVAEVNTIIRGNGLGASSNVAYAVMGTGELQNVYVANTSGTQYPSAGKYVTAAGNVDVSATGVVITTSGGKVCNIAFAAISRDMAIRTLSVCDNGTAKSQDFIASATY